jgi:hypothetical protein
MRNHCRDYSLRIMQYPGERLLHADTRDVRSLVGCVCPGTEVTVMVNGAPEGQPFYYQGSVNFHFVSKGVARIFNSVTWQPWIDALAPVITLAKDMDEAIEAAALTPAGRKPSATLLPPKSDVADAIHELGAFLAVHGYVAAPAKDGQGWDAMDAVQCSRGGGIRWVEFEPVGSRPSSRQIGLWPRAASSRPPSRLDRPARARTGPQAKKRGSMREAKSKAQRRKPAGTHRPAERQYPTRLRPQRPSAA